MPAFYPTLFLVLSIVSLSLFVVKIAGAYAITLAAFFTLIFIIKTFNKIKISSISVFLSFICFLMFKAAINVLWIDVMHFFRSFLLTSVFIYCYISSFTIKSTFIFKVDYRSFLIYSTVLIVGFELLQILEQFLLGSTDLWFLLDGLSISTADNIDRFEAVNFLGFSRPISFYHEPSYLGTVLLVLFAVNDIQVKSKLVYFTLLFSILLTLSSTAVLFLFMYVLTNFINQHQRSSVLIILFAILALIVMQVDLVSILRIDEIFVIGTSGWYRVMFPMEATIKVLEGSPFGIPLAQAEFIYDNSLFLIISYFGVLTPFLALGWIVFIKHKLKTMIFTIKYFVVFFCTLFLSGAIFTFESTVLCILLNFAFINGVDNETAINYNNNV